MKKILFTTIFCLMLLPFLKAQSNFGFSLKGGASLPLGEYSSNNLEEGAFTTIGMSLGADAFWNFYKNLGVVADFSYSLHSVDASALATETLYASEDPLLNDLYVRSDPYKTISFLLGLQYEYQLFPKFSIEPKALMGIMIASTPFQLFETEYFLLPNNYFKRTSSRDESFAMKAGLAFKYDIATCLMLKVSGDITHANMSFGFYNSSGKYYRDQTISYLDLSLGLVYKIGKPVD